MPCLIGCLALSVPRLVLLVLWLFTDYIGRAFERNVWFLLGFVFLPCTTLAYAWARNSNGTVEGGYLAVVIVGVLFDLGIIGFGPRARRRRDLSGPPPPEPPPSGPREITVPGQRVG
jgi:hypothetical protein